MSARAEAVGILTEKVNGQDIRAVYDTALGMVERARRGEGPAFMLCDTYRFLGHHVGDIQRSYYRSREEEERWKTERDPLKLLAGWLVEQGMADSGTNLSVGQVIEQIEQRVRAEVEAVE